MRYSSINYIVTLILFVILFFSCEQKQETNITDVKYRIIADGLFQPWSVQMGKDGFLWITENENYVSRVKIDDGATIPMNVEMKKKKEDYFAYFMHGLAFHPDFPENPTLYLSYMYLHHDDTLTGYYDVVKARYNSENLSITDEEYILEGLKNEGSMIIGGRLFTNQTHLFVCTADEKIEEGTSQNLDALTGKILRFNPDGSVPTDNPFPGSPIYTYGHRNPQGIIEYKGDLYTSEHGPSDNDEINKLIPGRNFGWPRTSGTGTDDEQRKFFTDNNIVAPLIAWTPTVAPSSLAYYVFNNKTFFLLTTLKEADLRILALEKDTLIETNILLDEKFGRLRDIHVTPEGKVYLITFNQIQRNFKYNHTPNRDANFKYDILVELQFE